MRWLGVTEREFGKTTEHALNVDTIKGVSRSPRANFGCTIHFKDDSVLDVIDTYESVVGELLKVK